MPLHLKMTKSNINFFNKRYKVVQIIFIANFENNKLSIPILRVFILRVKFSFLRMSITTITQHLNKFLKNLKITLIYFYLKKQNLEKIHYFETLQ